MKTKSILYFFLWISVICHLFAEDEIEVGLTTSNPLIFAYLSPIYAKEAEFEEKYLQELKETLRFDLHYNGYFSLVPEEAQKNILLEKEEAIAFDKDFWKDKNIGFIFKAYVHKKDLCVQIFLQEVNQIKRCSDITLTGNLDTDRRKIHQLADAILEKLLNKKGIATTRILFTIRKPNPKLDGAKWFSDVWICDYDGGNARQLTFENSYCVHPIFIPAKQKKDISNFLYISFKTGQSKIYRSSLDGSGTGFPVISLRGNQLLPAISVDADKLAFISDAAGRPDLFIQYFTDQGVSLGKPKQLFSYPRATQASPCFSYDGKKMAFVSDKDGSPRIYVIKIPETKGTKRPVATLITKKNRHNVTPAWSADSTKIAFSATTDNVRQIWIYDFETDEEWQLTKGVGHKENPTWAPDSLHLMYNTEDKTSSELYLININQKEPVRISSGFGKKRFPSWEPL